MTGRNDEKFLTKSPYHLLKRAAQYAANLYTDDVGKDGLTQRQYTVLATVEQNVGVSQIQLVKLTGIDRSTLADMISRLASQGLLQRKRDEEDGRANVVKLTAAGRRALKSARPGASSVDKKLLAAVPYGQRKAFMTGLASIAMQLHGESEKNKRDKPVKRAAAGNKPARKTNKKRSSAGTSS